ncbi:MAG: hypothetical protein ABIH67_01865 [Candidatus Uhrbacteria bacterium]|nr:hypothetical protein [Patescibacteria group bacterium]
MGKVIVLEGLPASGKTTLANHFCDRFGFIKVNESIGRLSGIHLIGSQTAIFEDTKMKYAKASLAAGNSIIDRGYPSLLAWDYCTEQLHATKNFREKEQWITYSIQKNEIFEPDAYFYLKIDQATSLRRRFRKTTKSDVWSGVAGMDHCQCFYNQFFSNLKTSAKIIAIDATETLPRVIAAAEKHYHDI